MNLLVKNPFFDKYHPEDMFYPGDIVEVENIERARLIINSNLAVEVSDAASRKMKSAKSEPLEETAGASEEPKQNAKNKRAGKKRIDGGG